MELNFRFHTNSLQADIFPPIFASQPPSCRQSPAAFKQDLHMQLPHTSGPGTLCLRHPWRHQNEGGARTCIEVVGHNDFDGRSWNIEALERENVYYTGSGPGRTGDSQRKETLKG